MKRTILTLTAILCCIIGFAKEPKRPDSYNYQRGCELIDDEKIDEGMEFLKKELRQNPKNGYAYAWMASVMAQEEEYGNAIYDYEQAIKYIPKSDKYYHAWAHNLRAGIALQMKDTVLALSEYTIAIKLEPKNKEWYEHRGVLYREMEEWAKSDADFKKYISLTPGSIRGQMQLGQNYFLQKRYDEALSTYTYANQLAERSWTLSAMAKCEVEMEKYEEAANHVVEALKLEDMEQTALEIINKCTNEEFVELVQAQLRVQIAKNPNSPEWLVALLLSQRATKHYEDAILTYHKIRKIYPDDSGDYIASRLYEDMGDWQHALQYINLAIDGDSTETDIRRTRVEIYNEMDSVVPMYADLDYLIREYPDKADFYFHRANIYLFRRNYKQAIEDYSTGIAIEPSSDMEHYMRGRCYEADGQKEKAQKEYTRVENCPSPSVRLFSKASLGKKEEVMVLADSLLKADSTEYRYNVACAYALIGEKELALRYIEEEMRDGYVRFTHLRLDPDLQSIQGEKLEQMIQKYERIRDERIARFSNENSEEKGEERVVEVPFTASNGVTKVECTINGLPLSFIFDTGASDVSLSQTEANFMYKNGYLSQKDVIGKQRFQTADGNISIGTTIMLNHINFGGLELTGVRASIVANQKAPLLLGQTVLQRLGKIEIDNERKVLKITTQK